MRGSASDATCFLSDAGNLINRGFESALDTRSGPAKSGRTCQQPGRAGTPPNCSIRPNTPPRRVISRPGLAERTPRETPHGRRTPAPHDLVEINTARRGWRAFARHEVENSLPRS